MKTIRTPKESILKILGTSLPKAGTKLHLSQFTVCFPYEKGTWLINTFTGEILFLENSKTPAELCTVEETCNNDLLSYLISHHFYVPVNTNETERYCRVITIIRAIKEKKGITSYTILPTTKCNARCFYCFELGYQFLDMTSETVAQTVDFIRSTRSNEPLEIDWFGGEPLLGLNQIRAITDSLNKDRIQFRSHIVTNGSLFSEPLIIEAKKEWNLERVQITLDGRKEEYCARKNYIDCDSSVYDTVISNIRLLLRHGLTVMIRMNLDFDNIGELYSLADELNEKITVREHLVIHAAPLITTQTAHDIIPLWKECTKLEKYLSSMSFQTLSRKPETREYYCIAHNPSAVTINADGTLYSCNHCHADAKIGTLGNISCKRKQTAELSDVNKKCVGCPWLPDCTEFDSCPDRIGDCRLIHEIQLKHSLGID